MKTPALLIAAVILLLMLPASIEAVDDFRLTDQSDPFVVASGATSVNVTLSQDLYNDDTQNVSSITSNTTGDAAIASSYVAATNVLNITGLDSASSHYLTVIYSIDGLADYAGAGAGSKVLPVLLILGILTIVGASAYNAFGRRE